MNTRIRVSGIADVAGIAAKCYPYIKTSTWYNKYKLRRLVKVPITQYSLTGSFPPIKHPYLEENIKKAATFNTAGVHVLWMPSGAGKTCALKKTAMELIEDKALYGGVYINYLHNWINKDQNLFEAFKLALNIQKEEKSRKISSLLPSEERVLIIIDQLDNVLNSSFTKEELKTFIVSLAEDSYNNSKKFVVILAISDLNLANSILKWNDKEKILPILPHDFDVMKLKWNEDQLSELYNQLIDFHCITHTSSQKNKIMNLSIKSGTPRYILKCILNSLFSADDVQILDMQAEIDEKNWITARKIYYKE